MSYSPDEQVNQEQPWQGVDCRRAGGDRRINSERRFDPRGGAEGSKRSLKAWIRSLTNPRIGIDRRKGSDRRRARSGKTINIKSLLTREELSDLLK